MKTLFLILLLLQNILSDYNPNNAIAYAQQWAHSRNPNYHDYSNEGGDCANFVSQCLIAGGLSLSGCEGTYGQGGTIPWVPNIEKCLMKKGWTRYYNMPSAGIPKGSVIIFNDNQHTVLCVQGGTSPLVAGHTTDQWMAPANWGTKKYFVPGNVPVDDSLTWFPYVNGYDTSDGYNGYAGEYGKAVRGLKIKSGTYAVHTVGGKWLDAVKNDRIAGNKKAIDGVAIKGGVRYKVHIMGGGWLPEVNGYNFKDSNNGYAGILGRTIDAIAIKGQTYATAY